jgi:hypothetical protein
LSRTYRERQFPRPKGVDSTHDMNSWTFTPFPPLETSQPQTPASSVTTPAETSADSTRCVTSGRSTVTGSDLSPPSLTTLVAEALHAMTQHTQRNTAISSGASSPTTFPSSSPPPSSGWSWTPQGAPAPAQAAAYTRRSSASEREAVTRAQQRLNPLRNWTHPAPPSVTAAASWPKNWEAMAGPSPPRMSWKCGAGGAGDPGRRKEAGGGARASDSALAAEREKAARRSGRERAAEARVSCSRCSCASGDGLPVEEDAPMAGEVSVPRRNGDAGWGLLRRAGGENGGVERRKAWRPPSRPLGSPMGRRSEKWGAGK